MKTDSTFSLVALVAFITVTVGACSIHYARKIDGAVDRLIREAQETTTSVTDFPYNLK